MKVVNRIKANEDFAYTVRKGHTLKTSSYIIHFMNNEYNICRVGISCSKKIGNAVTRNRIKRQIRAMCDSLINYSDHTFDIVIIVRSEFLNSSYQDNSQLLSKMFKQIGLVE